MDKNFYKIAVELLNGAYDLHTHTEPSAFNRALDDFDLVYEASQYKMAGVMIKSHYEPTHSRANLVNRKSGVHTKALGGIVLNWPNGGLNPFAVENALKNGAIIVWMPTRDSKNCLKYGDMPGDFFSRPGITILDKDGNLLKEVYTIFEIVKKYNAYLATGHLSPKESIKLCEEGRKNQVNMILTHPEWPRTVISGETQKYLAQLGVLIEKNWLNVAENSISIQEMAKNIRMAGIENVYLATDRGQNGFNHPVQEMISFIIALLQENFSKEEIKTMIQTVPSYIVNKIKR